MWTTPRGTTFFSFFLNTFFFAVVCCFAINLCLVIGSLLPRLTCLRPKPTPFYFLPGAFFFVTVARRGPFRVRALVLVR